MVQDLKRALDGIQEGERPWKEEHHYHGVHERSDCAALQPPALPWLEQAQP